ncbi:MAG: hypothetical protein LUH00_04745, partial [Lachnospiraceae bacterium]|nr:hypothetical protein [Lachnospiraceae bacterium]
MKRSPSGRQHLSFHFDAVLNGDKYFVTVQNSIEKKRQVLRASGTRLAPTGAKRRCAGLPAKGCIFFSGWAGAERPVDVRLAPTEVKRRRPSSHRHMT